MGISSIFPQRKSWGHGSTYLCQSRSVQFCLFWHISSFLVSKATYSQGWKQGNWLSSISDRDSCPGHIFIIKPFITVKTAEHFLGDWAKLPQETCWFQPPGQSRCSDLLFILLNTFIDLSPSPSMYKGRFPSFPHGASTGPRNWSQGDIRKQEAF